MSEEFILHDELLKLAEGSHAYYINNEVAIHGHNDKELGNLLNGAMDKIEESPQSILDPEVFDTLRSFIKFFHDLKSTTAKRLLEIILSGFHAEIRSTSDDIDADDQGSFQQHRTTLEMYGFLLQWFISVAEDKSMSKVTVDKAVGVKAKKGGRATKSRSDDPDGMELDWTIQKQNALDAMGKVLELRINKIWTLTPDRDTFVSLFTKPAYLILENQATAKASTTKHKLFKILGICVKHYNHAFAAQTIIIQDLQYYEHSAEPMAEFLTILSEQYDWHQLTDEILIHISKIEFKDTTVKEVRDTPNPKTFAAFLVKLAELSPKGVLKQMGSLIGQLDSESYMIRMAIIEILSILITDLSMSTEQNQMQKDQINGFFDILEERFLDNNAFCRSKVLQVYLKILDLQAKFPKRRQKLGDLAYRHLEDKSSYVRKNAIKILTKLISTHPYGMYGGELLLSDWEEKLEKVQEQLDAIKPPEVLQERLQPEIEDEKRRNADSSIIEENDTNRDDGIKEGAENEIDNEDEEMIDANMIDQAETNNPEHEAERVIQMASTEEYLQLDMIKRYFTDAIRFITQLEAAVPTICQLLASKTKAEVLEAMEFMVTAYRYKIEAAQEGIKRMLHLIWTKDNSDEGKGVKTKLLESYDDLYLQKDGNFSEKENINMIAKNLIQLTFNTTLAELTSLEQLLGTLMAEDRIADDVIDKLWAVYGTKRDIPKVQRLGAAIILGMLAKAKMEVMSEKTELLLKIGLGPLGKADLELAKYTCIALQSLAGSKTKEKGMALDEGIRLPMSHPIFIRLQEIVEEPNTSTEWYGVAEQAINTIYLLGEHPDLLCSQIIKAKTNQVFDFKTSSKEEDENGQSDNMQTDEEKDASGIGSQELHLVNPVELSQLFFVVGHVAVKHIVHLEIIEAVWKRKKAKTDDEEKKKKSQIDEELEQVVGTAEDDIGDAIQHIRERELLFGSDSLLANYGTLLSYVCANNKVYNDRTLQITATLALAKLMCVSADFCEKNLQLLFTILEKSTDATIRSNLVIALGDIAVCFNNLIDENISFLYKRLNDTDNQVKKNTLMVLTHLILNGMVKVKGQIGEMARCLEDQDQRISDLAKLFFTELASKDNAIYNNLPDIISNLSSSETKVDEESFKKIMKFLFEFIDKERQAENVVEKLCQRFRNTDDERGWRDVAYCLSLLPYKSEKSFKKLIEGVPNYQDKLHEETVAKYFGEIITKGKMQKAMKPEMKSLIDEFEAKLNELERRGTEANEVEAKAVKATKKANAVKKSTKGKQPKSSAKPRTAGKKSRSKKVIQEDEEDENEEEEEEEAEDSSTAPTPAPAPASAPTTPIKGRRTIKASQSKQTTDAVANQEETPVPPKRQAARSSRAKRAIIEEEEHDETEEPEPISASAPKRRAARSSRAKKSIVESSDEEHDETEEPEPVPASAPKRRPARSSRAKKSIVESSDED